MVNGYSGLGAPTLGMLLLCRRNGPGGDIYPLNFRLTHHLLGWAVFRTLRDCFIFTFGDIVLVPRLKSKMAAQVKRLVV